MYICFSPGPALILILLVLVLEFIGELVNE